MSEMKRNSSFFYSYCEPNCSVHFICTISVWSFRALKVRSAGEYGVVSKRTDTLWLAVNEKAAHCAALTVVGPHGSSRRPKGYELAKNTVSPVKLGAMPLVYCFYR